MHAAHPRRHPRAFAAWLLAVFLLGLLAPGISAALAHARGDFSTWQDICRAPTLSSQAADPSPVDKALDLLANGHCAACHIHLGDLAGPPATAEPTLRNDLALQAPERFWTAPVTAHAWRPASARAPPRLI
ncbi:DUF2946 family protein [Roseateles cellulosilyticus]|uniref:DUF2946 family protein n=1 Tax=Pelomonas cellulosilytica TaxID=2906762 RepID=A0ABS8Y668_9BURK|nr:DUF2946 family protein [Pelomonas sp. P8]MCE4558150.1 DUF2946 family protein [Pelomonas sp. P8]